MSVAAKMREDDSRNMLIIQVVKAIHRLKPEYIKLLSKLANIDTFIKINKTTYQIQS